MAHPQKQPALEAASSSTERPKYRPYCAIQAERDEQDAIVRGRIVRQQHEALAAEIAQATGCGEEIASIAAGSFINFRSDPNYGLSDPPVGWAGRHADALFALRAYLASPVSAAQLKAA